MDTGNRLTAVRGKGRGEKWWEKGKGVVKEHGCMTIRCGDGLWEWGWGGTVEGKGGEIGTTVME